MNFTATKGVGIAAAAVLAVACAPIDDATQPVEDAPRARSAPTPPLVYEAATVLRIIDGDTFDARLPDGHTERIRPPQFDAPERGECWHREATALLEQLIGGRVVHLIALARGPDRDRHGRLLRAVEIDSQDIGAQMLQAGAARRLSGYSNEDAPRAAMYDAAEARARHSGAGAWTACHNWLSS